MADKAAGADRPIERIDPTRDLSMPALFREPAFATIARDFIQDLEGRLGEIRAAVRSLGDGDAEAFRGIRSSVHALKGAGGTAGYEVISVVCHALEECLARGVASGRLEEEGFRRTADSFFDLLARIRELAAEGESSFRDVIPEINSVIDEANASFLEKPAFDPPSSPDDEDPGPPRVLIVDAPGLYRRILRQLLEGSGARAIEASGVAEALECLETRRVDAVVVARDLRGIGGASLVAAMKTEPSLRGIPVLLVQSGTESSLPEALRPDRILEDSTAAAVVGAVNGLLRARAGARTS
ncbi:MAG: Hpt domain-containing protein [Planctomycetes bacterium]|nr:Hpt domain-containing protein [Planctomycetota bacterium]